MQTIKSAVATITNRRKEIYLDNNATTKVSPKVIAKMGSVLARNYGNASSLYKQAFESASLLENSRVQVAKAIGAEPEEIFFTSCATEANNTILKGLSDHFYPMKNRIIALPIEHPSVIQTLLYLQSKGVDVQWIPVDSYGNANLEELKALINDKTFLVVAMFANNETGTIQQIDKIIQIAHEKGALFFSDCVQALGKVPLDFKACHVDYASFSAHKIHGPKGIGSMFVRKGCHVPVFLHGGHQERGFRAGTESIHNIVGFAQACSEIPDNLKKTDMILRLRKRLLTSLKEIKPDLKTSTPENSIPNTLSLTFPGTFNAELMAALDHYGISAAVGSACNTPDNKPSHVLTAIGLTETEARQTIRLSLSAEISNSDIDYVVEIFKAYFNGTISPVNAVWPKQLNESMIESDDLFILDIRFWYDRLLLSSIDGSYESSIMTFKNYLDKIPENKHILVICQGGLYSPIVAFYLRSMNFSRVSYLATGIWGWKNAEPELFSKRTGKNIGKLDSES
ncbi:MAG: aminotransferase class V-fold PLP-dependent enzyme [Candidatus Rifleibacteriota bacterium]